MVANHSTDTRVTPRDSPDWVMHQASSAVSAECASTFTRWNPAGLHWNSRPSIHIDSSTSGRQIPDRCPVIAQKSEVRSSPSLPGSRTRGLPSIR